MSKLFLVLILILCIGCTGETKISVDLNSTFVMDSSFSQEEQEQIVQSLFDWEQVTRGIVNMKLIITDTPNLYGPLPKIIKSYDVNNLTGHCNHDANLTTIYINFKVIEMGNYNGITVKSVTLHEMGHAFGLPHENKGIMIPTFVVQQCIDSFTLEQFCDIHHCSMNDVQSNCQNDVF